ncbi:protein unc-80 homolog [Sparus aurata]|uniref:protein unc-80 homolog n=1 Tax=Sparus aurata TaxID=8175 RepID=UPI0011C1C670|nr:protein unc-80 homolog [Sparus aurata]
MSVGMEELKKRRKGGKVSKEDFTVSRVISPFTNQERREEILLNLLVPFLPPWIISTSHTKNFMLDASPAHCSTPGDTGKDLHREGLVESASQAAYLALNVVLICFERSFGNQWYRLSLQMKEMALRKVGSLAFWDFIDFIVRTRIPIFVLLRPFIQCKLLTQPADSQEEITVHHHIADQLERCFKKKGATLKKVDLLKILKKLKTEEFKEFKFYLEDRGIATADLENAERVETVNLMVKTFTLHGAVKVTKEVLKEIPRMDLLQNLSASSSGAEGAVKPV